MEERAVAARSSCLEFERFYMTETSSLDAPAAESCASLYSLPAERYGTILADPPWRFLNSTGKVAPEHKRLRRYHTMSFAEINALPVKRLAAKKSHLYLWC